MVENELNFKKILENSTWSYAKYNKFKNKKSEYYSHFYITKKRGGKRDISSPLSDLYSMQKNLQLYLETILNINENTHGFVKGKSHITNALAHKNSCYVLNCDIKNFFGSINRNMVFVMLKNLNCDDVTANKLSEFSTLNDCLPQGSPCSPILSNLYLEKFDVLMNQYAEENEMLYSRYVDDITFSSKNEINVNSTLKKVNFELKRLNLRLNYKKTRVLSSKNFLEVTGIRIIDGQLRIKKKYVKSIKNELYYINKYGVFSHMEKKNIKNVLYREHIFGKIMYVKSIENEKGDDLLKLYNAIDWTR